MIYYRYKGLPSLEQNSSWEECLAFQIPDKAEYPKKVLIEQEEENIKKQK